MRAAIARRIESVQGRSVQMLRGPRLLAVRVPRRDASALTRRLTRIRGVRFVERNHVVMRVAATDFAQAVPTDPLWPDQWGPALIGAPAVWKLTTGSPRVVIAVLDTGVDSSQRDLRQALVPGYDFVNGDPDPNDDNGHGTRTAGIVGARADNGVGISGVCPGCSVMPVKVVGADGTATGLQIASGITWATDHGASIISLSLGGSQSATVAEAVHYAESKGVLVVAAAGNNGNSQPFYPAAYPGVLSVAGTDPDNQLYPWSNRGSWVAVAAPGCDVTTFSGRWLRPVLRDIREHARGGRAGRTRALVFAHLDLRRQSSTRSLPALVRSTGVAGGRVDAVGTLAALGAKFEPAAPLRVLRPPRPRGIVGRPRAHGIPGCCELESGMASCGRSGACGWRSGGVGSWPGCAPRRRGRARSVSLPPTESDGG